ncbi:MAG TPA: M13 family metallopeptidase [Candidatus Polarisedimenticolaceae bacterium]|nr:M13 family metallopeptidase [Candidatus Polarisedimenticolaceae bacterium]
MRLQRAGSIVFVLSITATAFAADLRGIEVGDLDRTADPCTDFFQYANGTWRANNPIPSYMDRWSRRWASGEINKDQLHAILDDVSARKDWPAGSPEQLIGDMYGACMDQGAIDKRGLDPAKPMLAEIDGIKDRAALVKVIGHFQDLGIAAPFGIAASPDNHDPTHVIGDVFAAGLGMPDRDYYLKPEKRFAEAREKYREHVKKMFALAGQDAAAAQKSSDTVFAFEKQLAQISLDNVALRDPAATDHKTEFKDLVKMTPSFDWAAYFMGAKIPAVALNVQQPKFMKEVDRQLAKAPLPTWKTYLTWQFLHASSGALSAPFEEESFAFYGKYLSGATEMKPRWKRCVENVDGLLGEALGRKYVEKNFPPEAKARMQEMVKNILLALKDRINGLPWMEDATKQKALAKLATFNPKIGYPDKWKTYAGVTVTRDSFWNAVESASRWGVGDSYATIGKPVDRGRWGMTPPTSNAYYNPLMNEIVFPAGILQPPAFSVEETDAVNYGAIGVVIGHEVSHGFDDQGAQYDAQGQLKNWWTAGDLKKFQAQGQCVVDQFEGYFIEPGIHHNGRLVLGESIGDLAGAKLAFLAYEKSREGKPPEPTIDGFTPEQQFFISWGQWRGDETRPETQRRMVQGDPHPVAKYRVNGPLSNIPAFQQAFACKQDAAMVRPAEKRCEVW